MARNSQRRIRDCPLHHHVLALSNQTKDMKYEYISRDHNDVHEFDSLGRDGWELVTATPKNFFGTTYDVYFVFRRPLS